MASARLRFYPFAPDPLLALKQKLELIDFAIEDLKSDGPPAKGPWLRFRIARLLQRRASMRDCLHRLEVRMMGWR